MSWAKDWWKSKTTYAGLASVLTAAASYLMGKESLAQAEQQVWLALMAVFIRDTISKGPASRS